MSLVFPAVLAAQAIDVIFQWRSSPVIDGEGGLHAPAVEYEVYHQADGGQIELVATVTDTVYTLPAQRGVRHRIRVLGVDVTHRPGELSEWSEELYFEDEIPPTSEMVPGAPDLRPNYPNPFNPATTIVYGVPESTGGMARVSLEIYDILGRRVRVLRPSTASGWHEIQWHGVDDYGQLVPTGQYIIRFSCNGRVTTNKMTLVK